MYSQGGNVTSAGWQVTLYDPMWHVSSRSGVATLRTAIHLLLFNDAQSSLQADNACVGLSLFQPQVTSILGKPLGIPSRTQHTQRSHRKQKACINLGTPIGDDGVNCMRMLPILQRLGVAYGL